MLSVVMLSVIMLSVVMLSVIMLSVVILSVMAPFVKGLSAATKNLKQPEKLQIKQTEETRLNFN
jgi:hypothetical protein